MLLLIYTFAVDIALLFLTPFNLVPLVMSVLEGEDQHFVKMILSCIGYSMAIALCFIMYAFLKYHFELIDSNKTTIEHLDEKRGNIANVTYDMGRDFNWKFVFGYYKACWLSPYDQGIGASMGDGVVISKRDLNGKETSFNLEDYEKNQENLDKSWANEDANNPLNDYISKKNSNKNDDYIEFY